MIQGKTVNHGNTIEHFVALLKETGRAYAHEFLCMDIFLEEIRQQGLEAEILITLTVFVREKGAGAREAVIEQINQSLGNFFEFWNFLRLQDAILRVIVDGQGARPKEIEVYG